MNLYSTGYFITIPHQLSIFCSQWFNMSSAKDQHYFVILCPYKHITGFWPSSVWASMRGLLSMMEKSRAAARLPLVKSGALDPVLPTCIPPNMMAPNTLYIYQGFTMKAMLTVSGNEEIIITK